MPFGEYKDFDECVRKNKNKNDPKAYCGKIKAAVEEDMNLRHEFRTREIFDASEAEFEEDDGRMMATIRILRAGLSKNNRNYRPEALRQAAKDKVFDGIRMFINHSKSPPLQRSVNDMVSAVESTFWDEADNSLKGRVEFFERPFYEKVKAARKYLGTSIDALVRGDRIHQPGKRVMEDIYGFHEPRSVDWVLFPAAGGEILAFESEGDLVPEIDWSAITEEDIQKNLPTLWAKWHPENHGQPGVHGATEGEGSEELLTKEQVAQIVEEKLTAYQNEQKLIRQKQETAAEQVREAFAKSGLPEKTRARLVAAYEGVTEVDEKQIEQSIIEAKEELKAAGAGPRITDMGPSDGKAGDGDKTPQKPAFSVHESVVRQFGRTPVATTDDTSKKEN